MSEVLDENFLLLVKSDKKLAFQMVFDAYWSALYRQAIKKVHCRDEAKDLVQETFLTLWDKMSTLDTGMSVLAYLYTVLRNKILNLYVKNEVRAKYALSVTAKESTYDLDANDALLEKELTTIINNEIASMPPRMREIYLLKRDNDISIKQIAVDLSLSEQTIKNQLQTAYQRLRARARDYTASPT